MIKSIEHVSPKINTTDPDVIKTFTRDYEAGLIAIELPLNTEWKSGVVAKATWEGEIFEVVLA